MVGIKFADFMGYGKPEIHCILRFNIGEPLRYLRFSVNFVNLMNVNASRLVYFSGPSIETHEPIINADDACDKNQLNGSKKKLLQVHLKTN